MQQRQGVRPALPIEFPIENQYVCARHCFGQIALSSPLSCLVWGEHAADHALTGERPSDRVNIKRPGRVGFEIHRLARTLPLTPSGRSEISVDGRVASHRQLVVNDHRCQEKPSGDLAEMLRKASRHRSRYCP